MKKNNFDNYISINNSEIIFQLDSKNIEDINTNFIDILPDVLLDIFKQKPNSNEFIFISYYHKNPVIKTILNIEGAINNEIVYGYLKQPKLLKKIYSTHFLLIEEFLNKLRIFSNFTLNVNLLAAVISLIIVIITIIFNWHKFIVLNPLLFLLPILMWWLLKQGIKQIINLYLPNINNMILGYLFKSQFILIKQIRTILLTKKY